MPTKYILGIKILARLPRRQAGNAKAGIAYAVANANICTACFNMVVGIVHYYGINVKLIYYVGVMQLFYFVV